MTPTPISYDSGYHLRHKKKAEKKARLVAERIRKGSSIVDIGCNAGLISKYLLEHGIASSVTGLEIDRSILHPYLQKHAGFRLIEGEIQNTTFLESYDSAIYFSVHHHIVAHHGLDIAVRTLRHIATHCRSSLLFETGKISEGSLWSWQPKLRQHFRFDEEHYCHIFRCLEDLVEDFEVIGYNLIHGVRREIFELRRRSEAGRESLRSELNRHRHSIDLRSAGEREILQNGHFTKTARIIDSQDRAFFQKHHTGNILANYREHLIVSRVAGDWAVKSLGLTRDDGILFPFVEGVESNLASPKMLDRTETQTLARQLKSIRRFLKTQSIDLPEPFLKGTASRPLYANCDLNPSNFLLVRKESGELFIRVVDFAYQARSYEWKNDINFARSLANLGESRLFRTYLRLRGSTLLLAKLLGHQLLSRKRRIINRFPSLLSAVFTELTNRFGHRLRIARSPGDS